MNIINIIDEIGKHDSDATEKLSRRDLFKNSGSFGKKIALAAVPVALAASFQNAFGRNQDIIIDVLNYALGLEYLENEFYATANAKSGLIPADRAAIFTQIGKHEKAHVDFLTATITALGGTPSTKPTFDFTAKGSFPDVFSNYQTFLTLSQAFEDTGVRAYKGRAADLVSNNTVLTAALQIHSAEARHASMVRRLRSEKGWITGATGTPPATYAGEDNTTQATVDVKTLGSGYSADIATQAFDEPLTPDQVGAIASLFIKS